MTHDPEDHPLSTDDQLTAPMFEAPDAEATVRARAQLRATGVADDTFVVFRAIDEDLAYRRHLRRLSQVGALRARKPERQSVDENGKEVWSVRLNKPRPWFETTLKLLNRVAHFKPSQRRRVRAPFLFYAVDWAPHAKYAQGFLDEVRRRFALADLSAAELAQRTMTREERDRLVREAKKARLVIERILFGPWRGDGAPRGKRQPKAEPTANQRLAQTIKSRWPAVSAAVDKIKNQFGTLAPTAMVTQLELERAYGMWLKDHRYKPPAGRPDRTVAAVTADVLKKTEPRDVTITLLAAELNCCEHLVRVYAPRRRVRKSKLY